MRQFPFRLLAGSSTIALCAFLLLGCGGKKDDDDYVPTKPGAKRPGTTQAASLKPVKASEHGVIKGKVTWTGGEQSLEDLKTAFQNSIAGKTDHQFCLTGKHDSKDKSASPIQDVERIPPQSYRVGKNKGLGNVFVWIEPERGHHFEIPKDQLDAVEKEVRIHQPHCAFLPHCTVLFPTYFADGKQVPSGQKFLIENDAPVTHNSKVTGGPTNGSRNITIPPKGNPLEVPLKPERAAVSLKCDIHGWMAGWIRVFDHPYATITSVGADPKSKKWEDSSSAKFGTFEIKGVPVGAKVKLYAWHEELGYLPPGGSSGKEVVLKKENVENFDAQPK